MRVKHLFCKDVSENLKNRYALVFFLDLVVYNNNNNIGDSVGVYVCV